MNNRIVNRPTVWNGLGKSIATATSVAEALQIAEMDYHFTKEPIFDKYGKQVKDAFINVRDVDRKPFGPVGKQYELVQPLEALDFLDSIIGSDIQIEQVGEFKGGSKMWMLAKAPERTILDDVMQPYVFVATSFDGSSNTTAGTMMNRLACGNQLNFAIKTAQRLIKIRHTAKLVEKVSEARRVIMASNKYIDSMAFKAERYAVRKLSKSEFLMATNEIFGDEDLMTGKQKTNVAKLKEQFGVALRQPDLENFKGSAWHYFNAMGDFASHIDPVRKTVDWKETLFESFMIGNDYLTKTERVLDAMIA
jgi:phage/plasmid-like protein (TIGR03299 family)